MNGPHGVLLTGGTSARMGSPKALLEINGESLARRTSRALSAVADPVIAVGIDAGLDLELIEDPQRGPLWGLGAGVAWLERMGCEGPVLLLGCDLPLVTPGLLALLVERLDGYDAAVPFAARLPQPLAACYGSRAREVLKGMQTTPSGFHLSSMRAMLGRISVNLLPPRQWRTVAAGHALLDVNTPGDLELARELAGRAAN